MNDILQPVKVRPGAGFMWRHPAHLLALGFGSGLSPKGPGTAGTLWASKISDKRTPSAVARAVANSS